MKNLYTLASALPFYCPSLVREFYSNLSDTILDPSSLHYHQVYIRGKLILFSPDLLIEHLEMLASDLTSIYPLDCDISPKAMAVRFTGGRFCELSKVTASTLLVTMGSSGIAYYLRITNAGLLMKWLD